MLSEQTVLIVDDEALFRSSLAEALGVLGPSVRVKQAGDGMQGWEIIKGTPVDLLVTDIKMPRMDGFLLLQNLFNSHRQLPVVVVTAFGTSEVEESVRGLGAIHFMDKPVELPLLVETVAKLLKQDATKSFVTGLSLAGFTQLLQVERKSCHLNVAKNGKTGVLTFIDGELIHADDRVSVGNQAALSILSWQGAALEMRPIGHMPSANVSAPLTQLVLDALRILDEATPHESLPVTQRDPALSGDLWFDLEVDEMEVRADQRGKKEKESMIDIKSSAQAALKIDGSLGAALVDYESGMCLSFAGNPGFDLELAAAGNADVVRAKKKIRDKLGLRDKIDDILISLTTQYHLIRMVGTSTFIYLVLDRQKSNLAMARKELEQLEKQLEVDRR